MAGPHSPAVSLDGLGKKFRLTHDRNWTLKATVLNGHRTRYEEFWALRDLTLDVEHGDTFGIVGGNGSGKSTLLRCINRLVEPTSGSVDLNGTELRAFAGNFLWSTGANEVAGRYCRGHFDLPMRNCTVALDGEPVVVDGTLVDGLA